ncbi:hypothetical protein E2562_022833 [Oryza meyeriana var. granulata]|uniref:Uncharacterized protein n=1 Tax=Oryza meyeriana var. granulata TaxID=110450 RepID=A0A6G1BN64_9ORYZ|nr:hypothetical protein E2562_022833 [Oryza meyeriana var. granulata]
MTAAAQNLLAVVSPTAVEQNLPTAMSPTTTAKAHVFMTLMASNPVLRNLTKVLQQNKREHSTQKLLLLLLFH